MRRLFNRSVCLAAILLFVSCTSKSPDQDQPLRTFSSEHFFPSAAPKCKAMLDTYCNYLYSPEVAGNLRIKGSGNVATMVLRGDTPNQFSQVFYRYTRAKIRNQNLLPKDFLKVLRRRDYFEKLQSFLTREPRQKMTLPNRIAFEQMNYELGSIWSSAINETLIRRMTVKYPGFQRIPDQLMPIEVSLEMRRQRRNLISQISTAIWTGDPKWKRVEATFEHLQQAYLQLIASLDVDQKLKDNWAQRIQSVKLVMPGSMPAISDQECSTTTANAYYYTYLNVITVCAGDFNSEDILQTLAHEMGHVLDFDRSLYLFEENSELGHRIADLRRMTCQPKELSCDQWAKFKEGFSDYLGSLEGFKPDLPDFQRCLKRRPTANDLDKGAIERFANSIINDRISELASDDRFLRVTKPMIPMRNGRTDKNPNYLNPCSYYLWSVGEEPVDSELTTMMFFTAEYRCSKAKEPEKFKEAIDTAKSMSTDLMEHVLSAEGEFSDRSLLESSGYSSPPDERFADVVGSYAMAGDLSRLKYDWNRRNKFLAGVSWLCLSPSLASHYPHESSVEKQYVFDSHAAGEQRKKELFTGPLRKVIGCQKDFQFNECRLPITKISPAGMQ